MNNIPAVLSPFGRHNQAPFSFVFTSPESGAVFWPRRHDALAAFAERTHGFVIRLRICTSVHTAIFGDRS